MPRMHEQFFTYSLSCYPTNLPCRRIGALISVFFFLFTCATNALIILYSFSFLLSYEPALSADRCTNICVFSSYLLVSRIHEQFFTHSPSCYPTNLPCRQSAQMFFCHCGTLKSCGNLFNEIASHALA
jgi:hypothetical protein